MMLNNFIKSFWISVCVFIGFFIPDYLINGVWDSVDIVIPIIVFGTSFLTLTFWGKSDES